MRKSLFRKNPFCTRCGRAQLVGQFGYCQLQRNGHKSHPKSEGGENYFKVIVDGTVLPDIHLDTLKHSYMLAARLTKKHTLHLFKRTE